MLIKTRGDYLKAKTECNFRNVVFQLETGRCIMSRNIPSAQNIRSYYVCSLNKIITVLFASEVGIPIT